MINHGPRSKMLFVLDLDFTHFNSAAKDPTWLGSKEAWLAFYQECIDIAAKEGVELIFAVVTNKPKFDDITEAAAIAFEPLLSIANPGMYIEERHLKWCLVQQGYTLQFECLTDIETQECLSTNVFSHFVIVPYKEKTPYILNIAQRHDILPEHCLLLDDTPSVVLDAKLHGIQTVCFEEFCPENLSDLSRLNDPAFVEPILITKREKILTQLYFMLHDFQTRNQPPQPVQIDENAVKHDLYPVNEGLRALIEQRDPADCLYSWGSFRLFLGEEEEKLLSSTSKESVRLK